MPGMTGAEATRNIRRNSANNGTIIVGVTASVDDEIICEMMESGMNDYISKPVKMKSIIDTCNMYCGKNTDVK